MTEKFMTARLTLRDINRALDGIGVEAFNPNTRRLHALRAAARPPRVALRPVTAAIQILNWYLAIFTVALLAWGLH
jgi:hypothetical protein